MIIHCAIRHDSKGVRLCQHSGEVNIFVVVLNLFRASHVMKLGILRSIFSLEVEKYVVKGFSDVSLGLLAHHSC